MIPATTTLAPATRIETRFDDDGWESCTWAEFLDANEDMDGEELAEIGAAVEGGNEYVGGGGAAPVFTVRREGGAR